MSVADAQRLAKHSDEDCTKRLKNDVHKGVNPPRPDAERGGQKGLPCQLGQSASVLLFFFMMAHRPEYAPQSVKRYSLCSDRLVFKTIIQPRTLLSRRIVIGSGGYIAKRLLLLAALRVYVASFFGWLLSIVFMDAPAFKRQQFARHQPFVVIGRLSCPRPVVFVLARSGRYDLLLLLFNRYPICFSYPVILHLACHLLKRNVIS
ncbi:hypothetical protein [Vreelandella sp. EE7]